MNLTEGSQAEPELPSRAVISGIDVAFLIAAASVMAIGSMWEELFSPTNSWTMTIAVAFGLLSVRRLSKPYRVDRN